MKYILALIILGAALIIALLTSCKYCEPTNIESGKSLQHHDTRKFRATYQRQGNFYVVTYKNMQEERRVIVECKPNFKSGTWQNVESN